MNTIVEKSYESMKKESIGDIKKEIESREVQLASLEIKT